MRKLLIIVLLLSAFSSFSQGSEISISNFSLYIRGDEDICNNDITLTVIFKDGSQERIFSNSGSFEGTRRYNDVNKSFPDKVIDKIKVYTRTVEKQGFRCQNDDPSITTDVPISIVYDPCPFGIFNRNKRNRGEFEVEHTIKFNWFIKPIPKINRVSSAVVGYQDVFRVQGDPVFGDSVYKWQYQITDIREASNDFGWSDIPEAIVSRILEVQPEDFLLASSINRQLHIRAIAPCANSKPSNSIPYILRQSAPHIIGVTPTGVSCYDSTDKDGQGDGSLVVTFDRDIDPTRDQLAYSIIDLSTNTPIKVNQEPITTLESGRKLTINGLPHSITSFRIDIKGVYDGASYYDEDPTHEAEFKIDRPSYVEFTNDPENDKVNVWCYGGSDGQITIKATGGTNMRYQYLLKTDSEQWTEVSWRPFENTKEHTITGLEAGIYHLKIRDGNACVAKEVVDTGVSLDLGVEITKEITITQPDAPLTVSVSKINDPRAFGFEDGRIVATITGGTPINGDSYNFQWIDENGQEVLTHFSEFNNTTKEFFVTLHSLGQGTYTIITTDTHHTNATNKQGCSATSTALPLIQPSPLVVAIEIYHEISCNNGNEYFDFQDVNLDDTVDQFQDGALWARVTGGERYESGNPYQYNWRIEQNGNWQDLDRNDSIIDFLSTARYALNITDKNGIALGDYVAEIQGDGSREYVLESLQDTIKFLPQPEKLSLSFDKTTTSCVKGNDAVATVHVQGGVPPYTYIWSNGIKTASNTDLSAGSYIVFIEDSRGCQIEDRVTIDQPNGMVIDPVVVQNPICYKGSDGVIQVHVSGGSPPYSYKWNNEETTTRLNGLPSGKYILTVTDTNFCTAFYEVLLEDPDPIIVDLGENRSLCAAQSLVLDIGIDDPLASYSWSSDNGFTSSNASVELFESGTYTAVVTTGLGCIGTASVSVQASQTPIDAHFIVNSQAYTGQEVILVNISKPLGDKVVWEVPETVQLLDQSDQQLVLVFDKEGPYEILLRSYQADCYQDFTKTIVVQPAIETPEVDRTSGNFIEEFLVYPNPNNGTFKVKISLADFSNIEVKIINLVSAETMASRSEKNQKEVLIDYLANLPTGVYLLLLETPKGSQTRKLIID